MLDKGMPAPDFEVKDAEGNIWRLSALRGQKVILYFYPADDTPGCTAEACDFRDAKEELQKAGYIVLGISPQDAASHRAFAAKYGINFPLLVDDGLSVAERYGVTDVKERFYRDVPIRIKRSTFVIDEDGKIADAQYGVDPRGHVAALKQALGV